MWVPDTACSGEQDRVRRGDTGPGGAVRPACPPQLSRGDPPCGSRRGPRGRTRGTALDLRVIG